MAENRIRQPEIGIADCLKESGKCKIGTVVVHFNRFNKKNNYILYN